MTQTYLDNLPDLGGGAGVSTSVAEFFQLGSTVHWVSQGIFVFVVVVIII